MININKKKILVLIPSRLESVRLTRKPLRLINGEPMIVKVAKRAINLGIGEVLVVTGNKSIVGLLNKYSIQCFLTKESHETGTDRIYEAYRKMNCNIDIILNIQGDLPYFRDELIFSIIDLMNDTSVDIGSAICDLNNDEYNDSNIVKTEVKLNKKNEGYALDFLRYTKKKKNFYHHIGVYAYRPKTIEKFINLKQTNDEKYRKLEQMRALNHGMKIKVIKVSENPPSIDTKEDLKKIRLFFRRNNV